LARASSRSSKVSVLRKLPGILAARVHLQIPAPLGDRILAAPLLQVYQPQVKRYGKVFGKDRLRLLEGVFRTIEILLGVLRHTVFDQSLFSLLEGAAVGSAKTVPPAATDSRIKRPISAHKPDFNQRLHKREEGPES
jgi:hypothetical protein